MCDEKAPLIGRFFFGWFAWWAGFGALFISFFVPLHFPPWLSWHSEMFVVAGTVCACCTLLARRVMLGHARHAVQLPRSVVLFLVLPAIALLQWLLGQLPYGGDVLVIGFYAALCVGCLALGFASGNDSQPHNCCEILAWVLLIAGVGSTFVAMAQTLDVLAWSEWIVRGQSLRRPGSNMAQPNHLALLLVMAMASLAYLNICSKVLGTWVSMLLFVLLATGLAMTESRAGLLQVWVLAALFYLRPPAAEARFSKEPRLLRWHGLTGAAFATALFIVYPAIFGLLTGADAMASRMAEGSTRFLVWPQLAEAIMLKPWFGWGMLQVGPAHNAVAHAHPIAEAFHYSHNIFIDLAIWAGLHIAVCLTALAAIWLLRHLVKTQTVRTLYTLALLLALGVASTLEYQHAYAYFLAPAAFAIGVLERVHDAKVWHFASVRVTLAAAVTVTGLMAWSAIEYFALEEDFRVVRFQTSRIGSTPQGYEVPTTVLLTQLSALANNSRIKITPTMTPEQLTALRNSALRYPWTATQSRYALALALNGNLAEGQRQLHVMRAQHGKPIFLRVVDELNLRLGENNSLSKFTRD